MPWSFQLFRFSPWGSANTGVVLAILLTAFLVILEFLSGRPQLVLQGHSPISVGCEYLLGDYRIGVVGVILLAYTTTARFVLTQWTREAAARLSATDFTDAESLAEQRRWGHLPGIAGAALCLTFAVDIAERPIEFTSTYWIFPHIFNWGWCIPFGWVAGRLFYSVPTNSILISKLAASIEIHDLAHREPLDAAIQHGSRSAFLSIIFLGLASVHFIDPGTGKVAAAVLVFLFVVGVAIATGPVVGAIARLRDTRDEEVERIRQERATEEAKMVSNDDSYTPGRLADLVALEKHLEEQRITIFKISNLVRLMLYAGVGLLSWLGAAAVSVFIEGLLDK